MRFLKRFSWNSTYDDRRDKKARATFFTLRVHSEQTRFMFLFSTKDGGYQASLINLFTFAIGWISQPMFECINLEFKRVIFIQNVKNMRWWKTDFSGMLVNIWKLRKCLKKKAPRFLAFSDFLTVVFSLFPIFKSPTWCQLAYKFLNWFARVIMSWLTSE